MSSPVWDLTLKKEVRMKPTDFSRHLSNFFGQYLPSECGLSGNTIRTYSISFTLLIKFMEMSEGIRPEHLCLADFTQQRIRDFLKWLEEDRRYSVSSRNARLGAIHSFFKYLQYQDVKGLYSWQSIMSIKSKKMQQKEMAYLSIEGIKLLLRQPDLHTRNGRRDFVLLGLLYDSAARVQELINLTPNDIRFDETATVRIIGKGSKVRCVPLSKDQAKNLKRYMQERGLLEIHNMSKPLFCNPQGNMLTRMAVLNIVKKYTEMAREKHPELMPEGIGCHSFRHSKAMHMLEADINLVYIRDFLGHSSTNTTEIYARVSHKKKQEALEKLNPGIIKDGKASWQKDKALLAYLKDLQKKY